ncbi:hypothetical protein SK128_005308 [Halocaridina rubra]|uniref:Uncharacterized protein n=1 Tax=Halocaridina rubra TaxID=373956 RepID=A0AAN8X210_HALRR
MEAESSDALASIDEMKAKIKEEMEELMASMMDVSLEGGAKLHSDDSVDSLMKTKLHGASEVEATMNEKLLELPNDKTLLMKLAQEEAENMTINNAGCLDFYQEKSYMYSCLFLDVTLGLAKQSNLIGLGYLERDKFKFKLPKAPLYEN